MSFPRLATFFAILATASMLCAQENRASISGQVTDPVGASVPSAVVKVVNVEQGVAKDTSTNDAGRYQVGFLEPGTYTETIEAPGFKRYVRDRLVLVTAQKMGLDVELEVGAQAETVTVT